MESLRVITAALLVIGGLNWGLVGLFQYNLVEAIFGDESTFSRIIYTLVGLSAVYQIFTYHWSRRGTLAERKEYPKAAA